MSLEYYELKIGDPKAAKLARALREAYGDVPLPEFPQTIEPISLDKVWELQANRLADHFASELGQSKNQYMDSLPKLNPQPENYGDRFDLPMIVQTPTRKLTLARMCEIVGIVNYLSDPKELKDWQKDSGKFKTPANSYITWLNDGSRNKERSVEDVRKSLLEDERGGTVYDGLALFIQNPDILKSHYLDLPGSQYGSDRAPCLREGGGVVGRGSTAVLLAVLIPAVVRLSREEIL